MPKFEIGVREVWLRRVVIEAKDKIEAEQIVRKSPVGTLLGESRFCYTLNSETWEFKEIPNGCSH